MGIAVDASGNLLIAGMTSVDPPLMNPWQSATGGLFLSKFASDGKTLLFSTRFGGSERTLGVVSLRGCPHRHGARK